MKKAVKISITLMLIFMSGNGFSQGYKHGFGPQFDLFGFRESFTSPAGSFNNVGRSVIAGVSYKASYGFNLNPRGTVIFSVTSYPFAGFRLTGEGTGSLGAEIPLLGEFFFGDIDYLGLFIGAGGSYGITTTTGFGNGNVVGIQLDGGLQFPIGESVALLKAAFTFGLNDPSIALFPDRVYSKSERNIFSVGINYIFGY